MYLNAIQNYNEPYATRATRPINVDIVLIPWHSNGLSQCVWQTDKMMSMSRSGSTSL